MPVTIHRAEEEPHLWLKMYLSRPVFAETPMDELQAVINDLLHDWSVELRAAQFESTPVLVGRTLRLFECVQQVAPPTDGIGSAELAGSYEDLSMYLQHGQTTLPPSNNQIAIEVYRRSSVEGQTVAEWAPRMFEALTIHLPVRYARACTNTEYAAKNMVDDEEGTWAIGADLLDAIPGIYWLNFFGPPYVDLIGRERLLSAPAHEVKTAGAGVLVALDSSPVAWKNADYRQRERDVVAHLGEQFFFSRFDPERKTIAPDFYALREQ